MKIQSQPASASVGVGAVVEAGLNAGSRVHDHAGGFVDHCEILILENDIERDILRLEPSDGFYGQVDIDLVPGPEFIGSFGGLIVDQHIAVLDQLLQLRTRPAFDHFRQERVQAFAGFWALDNGSQ